MAVATEERKEKVLNPLNVVAQKRARDEKMVTGTFIYRSKPGGRYKTHLRKYKRSPENRDICGFIKIDMIDGRDYTVPFWIAEWLNGEDELSCAEIRHQSTNSAGPDGHPIAYSIDIEKEVAPKPQRVPIFRFVIKRDGE